ncbi:MAG: hypothetical protein JJT96_11640 [Opitutales bacterium]|nr:hypothetical protein [Opitutales bacterium]
MRPFAAVDTGKWLCLSTLANNPDPSGKRLSARYKIAETTVEIDGTTYRAIVVHSSAHDNRRTRKLVQQLSAEKEAFAKLEKATLRETLARATDARGRPKQGEARGSARAGPHRAHPPPDRAREPKPPLHRRLPQRALPCHPPAPPSRRAYRSSSARRARQSKRGWKQ